MNDNTTKLLEQLASKLGTTSEYLWGILLKQAPIDATISIVYIILTILMWIPIFKAHKYLSNDHNVINYDDDAAPLYIIVMICSAGFALICSVGCFFSLDDIFNGYFNREFWALDYLLNKLKPSK